MKFGIFNPFSWPQHGVHVQKPGTFFAFSGKLRHTLNARTDKKRTDVSNLLHRILAHVLNFIFMYKTIKYMDCIRRINVSKDMEKYVFLLPLGDRGHFD